MSDCCQKLAGEVAGLRKEIAQLRKLDPNAIAEDGAKRAESRLNPQIAVVGVVATAASGLARQALAKILAFLAALASLEAIIAGVVAAVAFIAVLTGIVYNLRGRVGTLEGRVAGLFRVIDEVKVTATRALGKAVVAESEASRANSRIDKLEQFVEELQRRVVEAKETANKAIVKSNEAVRKANIAITEANKATAAASAATLKADLAIKQSNTAIAKANAATLKADLAVAKAETANTKANLAIGKANLAYSESIVANRTANTAITRANAAQTKAENAIIKANAATTLANNANNKAKSAILRANIATRLAEIATKQANTAINQSNNAVNQIVPLSVGICNANNTANNAIKTANNAVTKTVYDPKVIEPTITNSVTKTVQAIVPVSLAEAKAQNIARVAEVKSAIQTQYENLANEVNKLKSTITGVQAQPISKADIDKAVAASPAIQELQRTQAGIQPRVQNLENTIQQEAAVNQKALEKLTGIEAAIAATPVAVGAIVIPRLLTPSQVQSAAEAANCSTARPGGCTGSRFDALQGSQNNILNALNTAQNTGQTALLIAMNRTIDLMNTKLGSLVPGGGIGGQLLRSVTFAGIDRILTLATFAASIHNAMMLSNSIKETLFSTLDNIFAIPQLIINPNGETVDSKEVFTKYLDSYFANLFGASEWAAIKAQWKAYSTIYSSAAQGWSNTREIFNDTQELMNSARNYTAQLGNALVDEGVISEDNWDYKDPKHKIKSKQLDRLTRMSQGLETIDNGLQAIEQVTATLRNITQTANEIKENIDAVEKAVGEANKAAVADRNAKIEGLELPNFSLEDLF